MNLLEIILNKEVLTSVVSGAFAILKVLLKGRWPKQGPRLVSKEKTKTRNSDGSETKREVERYR